MVIRQPAKRQLTPDDWARAAFRAMGRGGVDAVAIEPIAAELEATKGSFYWHFKNRDSLIEAALSEWERKLTDTVIERLNQEPDPAERLKLLFAGASEMPSPDRAAELAILANPEHPIVRRAARRVSQRRITYMAAQFEQLGWDSTEALDRAVLVGSIYVGLLQAKHLVPHLVSGDARQRQFDLAFSALVTTDLGASMR
ncbi:MAG TPA: TetR/AcrR family transcriptional regulator [Acidimicrobiales bacterium]